MNTVIESTSSTFVLGNVNLYLDARPNDRWRALTEIRFTGYPHGEFTPTQPGRAFQRTNNQIFDVNSASGGFAQTRWGAIILERAQIEYSWADWLRVRGGSQGIITPSVGLNLHFTDSSQLKLQYSYSKQFDFDSLGRDLSHEYLNFLAARLVVAF